MAEVAIAFAVSAVVSYVNAAFIQPALAGTDNTKINRTGPRFQGTLQQFANEGSPMNFVLGEGNRVAGTIIWLTDIIETKHLQARPFRPYGITTTFTYSVHIAVGISEGEIEDIDTIWANGRKIFQPFRTPTLVTNQVRLEVSSFDDRFVMMIISINGGPDLTDQEFVSGAPMTATGWNFPANGNDVIGTLQQQGQGPGAGETFLKIERDDFLTSPGEAFGATVTIAQSLPRFSESEIDDVRIFKGSLVQVADPLIVAQEFPDIVPAFLGTSYFLLENLQLRFFGNQLPQFQARAIEKTGKKVNEAISDICLRGGLTVDQIDVSKIPDTLILEGFAFQGPNSAVEILQPLMKTFDILALEDNGKFVFLPKADNDVVNIREGDLAAHEKDAGAEPTRKISTTDSFGVDLPNEVVVQHIDPKKDYQAGMQRERNQGLGVPSDRTVSIQLPIVVQAAFAREIARRELWVAHANRRSVKIELPPSYINIQENDILKFDVEGEPITMIVKQVERGHNFQHIIEGTLEFLPAADQPPLDPEPEDLFQTFKIFVAGGIFFEVIDIAPFTNSRAETPGVYLNAGRFDQTGGWASALIQQSGDGANFFDVAVLEAEAFVGFVEGPRFPQGQPGVTNLDDVVTIKMVFGALESVTLLDMLNGANTAVIGREVIRFQNAVLVDTDTYELSVFLRGLRNTEDQATDPAAHDFDNERFILITGNPGLEFNEQDIVDTNSNQDFKAIPPGVDPGTLPLFKLTPMRNGTIQTFGPSDVTGTRDGAGELTIDWKRRTRGIFAMFFQPVPFFEGQERYEIDIVNPGGDVVRTFNVTNTTTQVYTVAEQITDGIGVGAPLKIRIFQLSDTVGRGNQTETII